MCGCTSILVSSTVCPCWDSGVIRASLYDASTALSYRNVDVCTTAQAVTADQPGLTPTQFVDDALGKYRPRIASEAAEQARCTRSISLGSESSTSMSGRYSRLVRT